MKLFAWMLCFAALFSLSTQARADNTGDTLHAVLYSGPSNSGTRLDSGTTITSPGMLDFFGVLIFVTPTKIILTEDPTHSATRCAAPDGGVCGFRIEDVTKDPDYASISVDPSSTVSIFAPSVAGNAIFLDFSGQTLNQGDFATFDVTYTPGNSPAATPEPGSLMLLGTGMLGVAGTMRKKIFARK